MQLRLESATLYMKISENGSYAVLLFVSFENLLLICIVVFSTVCLVMLHMFVLFICLYLVSDVYFRTLYVLLLPATRRTKI